ncbi:3181_t:CDS:2 [Paraglomus occultum]|uniref:Ribosome biogenesis regulatory protein n=1 Tax=Paraglomus occultum TaxID=144539 RepID=A0A9N8WCI0_9GLOM|nr:3181_t:CDS:2 [Paraglomus occultum]
MDVSTQLEVKQQSLTVEKAVPLEFDLALLAGFDINSLDEDRLRQKTDEYLKEYSRDGTQLIINEIFKLPTDSTEDGTFAELPDQITKIPREKPDFAYTLSSFYLLINHVPKPKPLTRWEKFAKLKGIQNRKKSRKVFDEATGDWVPRWGYKGANDDGINNWLIPVPQNADPYEDQFAKRRADKKERVRKNATRHMRNLEEAARGATRGSDQKLAKKEELTKKISISKTATASLGRFDKPLKGEPKMKGVKRKFDPLITDMNKEKEANLSIVNGIFGKKDKPDIINARKARNMA